MATPRITHDQREESVLIDVETSFPNFAEELLAWSKVPDGQDPPDFISRGSRGAVGLELVEWLDGEQMRPAKTRESRREQLHRVLAHDWEKEYRPQNFSRAFPSPLGDQRIVHRDEALLRQQFFACAAEVDRNWVAVSDERRNSHYQREFLGYPLLGKYLNSIRYTGGQPHGSVWIGQQGGGKAFDPAVVVKTLGQALDNKLGEYSTAGKQAHLRTHALTVLTLLVHGGFNIYAYNTPAGHITLEEIGQCGANYYATHPQRHVFKYVWFFHSIENVRWLARLWPDYSIYSGSLVS